MLLERDLIPYEVSSLPEGPWLLFAPHADDETFGLGGTLALAARAGVKVAVVILTDGALGGVGDAEALRRVRRAEARAAMAALGLGEPLFWDQPDRGLVPSEALIERVVTSIGEHAPAHLFFPSFLEPHVDHRAAARLVWEALRREARVRPRPVAYEITVQGPVNRLVDISAGRKEKAAAVECYTSQLAQNNYRAISDALDTARTFSLGEGVTAAEGFWLFEREALARPYGDLVRALLAPYWSDRPYAEAVAPAQVGSAVGEGVLVSVIVRTQDRPKLLAEALDSLVAQHHRPLEVVVVNDGGPAVDELLAGYGEALDGLRQLRHEVPRGRSAALNTGLDAAGGELIAFLDDDDWFEPDHLSALVAALRDDGGALAAYAGVHYCSARGADDGHRLNDPFDPVRLRRQNYIPIHAMLFSRRLLAAGCRVDERLEVYEDWDLWLQMSRLTRFLHVDRISAGYRAGGDSGAGWGSDPERVAHHQRTLLEKWRDRWTIAELREALDWRDGAREAELERALAETRERLAETERLLAGERRAREEILGSTSWRLSAPLRRLASWLRRAS